MSDLLPSPTPSATRRKRIVLVASGALISVMLMAFLFGGSKETPTKKKTEDEGGQIGFINSDLTLNLDNSGTYDDWINAPEGAVESPTEPETSPIKSESSVVNGDGGALTSSPISGQKMVPQYDGGSPPKPIASDQAAVPSESSPVAKGAQPGDTRSQVNPHPSSAMATTPDEKPSTQVAAQQVKSKTGPASLSEPGKSGPKSLVPSGNAGTASTPKSEDAKRTPKHPTFVRSTSQRPGIIAQSARLINSDEFSEVVPPSPNVPIQKQSTQHPAMVSHAEARHFAEQTTVEMREKGLLKPSQRARLPRLAEAPNAKIWREDDSPKTEKERRPFGLIISEDAPASTPEGIPLRTDIPAGTSPLEKTGPDKPLWKRPE
jgi:hypothetical protein